MEGFEKERGFFTTFATQRRESMKRILMEKYGLVSFYCDRAKGTMKVDGGDINGEGVARSGYVGEPARISVTPAAGYAFGGIKFTSWDGKMSLSSRNNAAFIPKDGGLYEPVFVKAGDPNAVMREPVAAAKFLTAYVIDGFGDLYGWGLSGDGQVSAALGPDVSEYAYYKPTFMLSGVKQVDGGMTSAIALTDEGEVYTWGRNTRGQLGRAGADADYGKVMLDGQPLRAVSVSSGFNHAVVLTENGDLYGFGGNGSGQVRPASLYGWEDVTAPALISKEVIKAACGGESTYFIKNNNRLYVSGLVKAEGDPANAIATDVIDVFAGYSNCFYITKDHKLYGFGYNDSRMLGSSFSHVPTPVLIDRDVKTGAASQTNVVYIKNDGSVWGLGSSEAGQLKMRGVKVSAPTHITDNGVSVAAGYDFNLVLTADGNVAVWGKGDPGLRGNSPGEDFYDVVMKLTPPEPLVREPISGALAAKLSGALVLLTDVPDALVDGRVKFIDENETLVRPLIINGRTLVPARFIAEALGGAVPWDAAKNTGAFTLGGNDLGFALGSDVITVNGQSVTLEAPVQVYAGGRILLPLRTFAESLGLKVGWNEERGMITVLPRDLELTEAEMDEAVRELCE
jgi:alpha-tubulin suppressor-like RCC1 family protein